MVRIPPSACRQPPPPRRCSDGNVLDPHSNMLSKDEGNSNTPMVGVYLNSRTRPYSFRRCKRVRSTNIESLPDELLFHILVRLPADHLCDRARVVCRRWYHIIHSHAFVNTQVQHSAYGLLLSADALLLSGHPIFVSATTQGRIETSEFSYKCRTRILGSCNGLGLEFQLNNTHVPHIINPATKQVFVLPSFSSEVVDHNKSGIAYAAASMEYKVTLPHRVLSQLSSSFLAILTVGVDNSWRHLPVETLPRRGRELLVEHPLLTEGFIHWARGTHVLTLDVETEVLIGSEVPLPQSYKTKRMYYLPTGRYLSLFVARRDFLWEVWGMEPETGEWRKLLPNIELEAQKSRLKQFAGGDDEVLVPLGWVKYPEVLALYFWGRTRTCIFYNLDTHEINSTELPGPCGAYGTYSAFAHMNSLIWLT